nr:Zgc:171509 protein [Danio rerio]
MNSIVFILLIGVVVYSKGDKIIGGHECQPHSQPWQARLDDGYGLCGGSLIHESWVVSAAHCKSSSIIVHLGKHDLFVVEDTAQEIQAEKVISHPKYNNREHNNDIMLIKLKEPAVINNNVKPVPLPTNCSHAGEQCLVSGWGVTGDSISSTLQCLELPILSKADCKSAYGGVITKKMFCAGFMDGGKDSCQGDSGGPVVCNGTLKGIVSFGIGCAEPGFPGVYVEVCRYINWINYIIANN